MSPCSAARTHNALVWTAVVWFTSVVDICGSQDVTLHVRPQVEAKCGGNVTLTCDARSSGELDIKLFSWLKDQTMCRYGRVDESEPGGRCESSTVTHRHTLTLTLRNVTPADEGKYLCKIQSNLGAESNSTYVTVRGCIEGTGSFTNDTHAWCRFTGVYPIGVVHWFQGGVNLTSSAGTWEEKDDQGRFTVLSELEVDKGNMSLPYNCSLWVPSDRNYLTSKQMVGVRKISSSGSSAALQGICVMVWLLPFLGL